MTLYFVSSNEEKYWEIRRTLAVHSIEVERVSLDLPEIQSIDPVQVAGYKARLAYERLGAGAALVEDTSLGVVAWNGYPGALIKWVLASVEEEGLCRQLDAWTDRRAVATAVLCLYDGHDLHTFAGQTQGVITDHPRGENGFGWDSIFQPDGSAMTYGEMSRDAKMQISMRAQALQALVEYLLR